MTRTEVSRFDPYYKWLGIPRREQPPNHYRLLGLHLYEADEQVINSAAERQQRFLTECGEKKYPELAERLVAEVKLACECLLNAETKTSYDAELKQQLLQSAKPNYRSRYTLQVDASEVDLSDSPSSLPQPEFPLQSDELPSPAPPPAAPPDGTGSSVVRPAAADALELALADEEPDQSSAGSTVQESLLPVEPKSNAIDLADEPPAPRRAAAAPAPEEAELPPVTSSTRSRSRDRHAETPQAPVLPEVQSDGEMSTATLVKLIAAACVVAGGLTVGLLTWLSGSSKPMDPLPGDALAVAPQPAGTPPAPEADAPSTTVEPIAPSDAAPETSPAAADANAPAAAPPQQPAPQRRGNARQAPAAAPAAAPAPQAATALANTRWQVLVNEEVGEPDVFLLADGRVQEATGTLAGTWAVDGEEVVVVWRQFVTRMRFGAQNTQLTGESIGGPPLRLNRLADSPLPPPPGGRTQPNVAPQSPATPQAAAPRQPRRQPAPAPAPEPLPAPETFADPGADLVAEDDAEPEDPNLARPFATARSFRSGWLMAGNATVNYVPASQQVVIDGGGGALGTIVHKQPWREASLNIHAEQITGNFILTVNGVRVPFATATVVLRRPANIVISHDPATGHISVRLGTRQIARLPAPGADFASRLTCELALENGRTRMRLSDLRIQVQ